MANEIIEIRDAVKSQLKKTDDVIASNKSVANMISQVGNAFSEIPNAISEVSYAVDLGFNELAYGLQELCFITENGFMEIADRIALQNETLKAIKEILERPLDIQAKELRKRAEFAYLNNWVDEAETDLLEAEKKNYQDFIVHQILGNIYFHHKKNYPKAIEYYQKAAKYASPVLKKHASNALVCASMIYYKLNQISDAHDATEEALKLSPDDSHVLYHHARYLAKMDNEFIIFLKRSIYIDPHYLITANIDEGFLKVRERIRKLAEELRDEEKRAVDGILLEINIWKKEAEDTKIGDIPSLNEQLAEIKKLYPHIRHFNFQNFIESKKAAQYFYGKKLPQLILFLNERLKEIKILYSRDSYFDFLEAKRVSQKTLLDFQKDFFEARKTVLSVYINSLLELIRTEEACLKKLKEKKDWIKNDKDGGLGCCLFDGLLFFWSLGLLIIVGRVSIINGIMLFYIGIPVGILIIVYAIRAIKLYKIERDIKKPEKIIAKLLKIKEILEQNIQNRNEVSN